jgi:hypothetical protein
MAQFEILLKNIGLRGVKPIKFDSINPPKDEAVLTSMLGTPVFNALEFKRGSYDEDGSNIDFDGLILDNIIITVGQSKTIIKTAVQGRAGTVKEFISDGDYAITVQGMITSPYSSVYPQEQVNTLLKLCKAPVPLKIVSKYLQAFGIYELVIENYDFPQREGHYNTQVFSLQCVSDTPFELELSNEKSDNATTISTGQQFSTTA